MHQVSITVSNMVPQSRNVNMENCQNNRLRLCGISYTDMFLRYHGAHTHKHTHFPLLTNIYYNAIGRILLYLTSIQGPRIT